MAEKIRIIFLGSARLLYVCARAVKKFYGKKADIQVIDLAYTQMNRKYESEFGNTGIYKDKVAVFSYLKAIEQPTYLFSINNPYILPNEICQSPWLTMINLHHGLLPSHPGRNAEAWTIYDMDEYGGITWHYISPGIDTGDMICQRKVKITEDMTSLMLLKACEGLAVDALHEMLPLEHLNRAKALRQNGPRSSPKKASEVPNDGWLDLAWDWEKSVAFLRAMDYGALRVLGKPKVALDGRAYRIDQYKVEDPVPREDGTEVCPLGDGKYLYQYTRTGRNLTCCLTSIESEKNF